MLSGDLAFIEEAVRSIHVATLAASAVLVVTADLTAARSAFRPLQADDFKRLETNHATLSWALLVFWISGAFLIWKGTGFDASQFSPKLIAKLLVVSALTLNAGMIGGVLLPFMQINHSMTFGEFSFGERSRLAMCGGISSASWVSAFCLGSIPWLKTASAEELFTFIFPIYVVFCTGAMIFSLMTVAMRSKPEPMMT